MSAKALFEYYNDFNEIIMNWCSSKHTREHLGYSVSTLCPGLNFDFKLLFSCSNT